MINCSKCQKIIQSNESSVDVLPWSFTDSLWSLPEQKSHSVYSFLRVKITDCLWEPDKIKNHNLKYTLVPFVKTYIPNKLDDFSICVILLPSSGQKYYYMWVSKLTVKSCSTECYMLNWELACMLRSWINLLVERLQ